MWRIICSHPLISQMLNRLHGSFPLRQFHFGTIFHLLWMKNGNQCKPPLAASCGQFDYNIMLFGLLDTPCTLKYQRNVRLSLRDSGSIQDLSDHNPWVVKSHSVPDQCSSICIQLSMLVTNLQGYGMSGDNQQRTLAHQCDPWGLHRMQTTSLAAHWITVEQCRKHNFNIESAAGAPDIVVTTYHSTTVKTHVYCL